MSRTGAPGRPSGMHFVENELNRRADSGGISSTTAIKKIAGELAEWYENGPRKKLPTLPSITSETIRKKLGQKIRTAINGARN